MNPQKDLETTIVTQSGVQASPKMKICPQCGMERLPTTTVCPADGTLLKESTNKASDHNPLSTLSERYEFLGETGRGGMAVIYKARNRETGRLVAIKKMLAAALTDTAFMRFQQEAKAITSLRHPNIIMVHEFGVAEDGEPFMVMDFIEGSNLSELIKEKGSLSTEDCIHRFIQLCDALQHAHAAGVLHRDLKPGNVMISSADGSFADARLVDFGIAKLMAKEGEEAEKLTMTGQLFGSPPYMSPEQCRGFALDARTDIYSMGCVMFESLTGKVPLRGESILETIMMQVNNVPPRMKEVCPEKEFSEELENIIAKALAKDPDDRFQTMRELMIALMEAGSELSVARQEMTQTIALRVPDKRLKVLASICIAAVCLTVSASALYGLWVQASIDTKNAELKKSENERLNLLTWTPHDKLTDKMLKDLLQTDLGKESIDLSGATQLTNDGVKELTKLKNLQFVDLSDTNVGDECLKALVTLPKLRHLDLKRTLVTDEGLKTLLQAKNLNILIVMQTHVSNKGMPTLAQMHQLSNLTIGYLPRVNGEGIKKLKDLHLNRLFMQGLQFGDSLSILPGMSSLIHLDVQNSSLSDDDAKQLKDMVQLKNLNISGTALKTKGMQYLSNLRGLAVLRAGKLDIEDAGIEPLLNLQNLRDLDLNSTRITTRGAAQLANIKSLNYLSLAATRVGDEAMAALATLPNLEKLDLDGTDISDIGLQKFRNCKKLQLLRLTRCPRISKGAVEKFDREFNHLDAQEKQLEEINSDDDVKRTLKIEYSSDSSPW